jgi:hypothetical protein
MQHGDPVRGEVSSDDAHLGVAVTFYPSSSTTARVLAANEFFTITDYTFVANALSGAFSLVMPTDAAGKRIFKGTYQGTAGGVVVDHHFETPIACPMGVTPVLFAAQAMGQVDLIISGYITQV